jgi:ribosomal protein S18 acetylase RimI-like enzyme
LCGRVFRREKRRFRIGEWFAEWRKKSQPCFGVVAVVRSRIVGILVCSMAPYNDTNAPGRPNGRLHVIAVDPGFRRRGIATAMWKKMEAKLAAAGARRIWTLSRALDWGVDLVRFPAAVVLLLRLGFEKLRDVYDQEADLTKMSFDTRRDEARLKRFGIDIRRAAYEDRIPLTRWLRPRFPQWLDVPSSIKREGRQNVHVVFKGQKLIAFSSSGGGGFGPIGVDPKYRFKGVGKILLLRCLADVRARGHRKALIGWANFPFYARAISSPITRILWQMEKKLR